MRAIPVTETSFLNTICDEFFEDLLGITYPETVKALQPDTCSSFAVHHLTSAPNDAVMEASGRPEEFKFTFRCYSRDNDKIDLRRCESRTK